MPPQPLKASCANAIPFRSLLIISFCRRAQLAKARLRTERQESDTCTVSQAVPAKVYHQFVAAAK